VRKPALLALLALLVAAFCGLMAVPAAAKDFRVTDVAIDAQLRPNGDLSVREARTLRFSGDFTFVFWELATKGSEGIEISGASGPSGAYALTDDPWSTTPGTYSVVDLGDRVKVLLYFRLADTAATFAVDYVVRGAATRWDDTAELYWQFIGADTGVPCEHVRVTVHPPKGVSREQVRAWAHGPLWGDVAIGADASVVLTVEDLPAYTFVEGRILFPAAALPAAEPTAGVRATAVLAEERRWAETANRQRLWARLEQALWAILGVGAPLAALALVSALYAKYGREPRPRFKAQYLRDIPQPALPPALVAFIWRMGDVGNDDATATLLDLIDRAVIGIERLVVREPHLFGKDEAVTYRLTRHEDQLGSLLPYERHLVEFLFSDIAEGSNLVLSDLKALAKAKRAEFAAGVMEWRKMATHEAESRRFLDATADRMAFWAAAAAFAAAVAAGAAAILSQWYWYFAGVPPAVVLIVAARAVKRRSVEAAELHAMYRALYRYMKDFGRLQEKPPDAVILWEQFLVYAVVFGIADDVVKALQVRAPEVVTDPAFGTMGFMMLPSSHGEDAPFTTLSQSFSQAVSVATSSSSSGSGGGGGFSGGGGGGGGGGGFGAG
jgi:uncharacterized membrane protein